MLSQTDFNRRIAAQRQVDAVALAYEQGTITLDVLLSAQQTLAQAESDYYRKLVDYNKSISQVHFRKGSLLEYNGVYLAEGPWPGKAYFDARRRALPARLRRSWTTASRSRGSSAAGRWSSTSERAASKAASKARRPPEPAKPELVPSPEPMRSDPGRASEPAPEPPPDSAAATGSAGEPARPTSAQCCRSRAGSADRPAGWTAGQGQRPWNRSIPRLLR